MTELESEEIHRYAAALPGLYVTRCAQRLDAAPALSALCNALDAQRGVLLCSGTEYPGRYTRWDIGFCDPPLALEGSGDRYTLRALNARGVLLLAALLPALAACRQLRRCERRDERIDLRLAAAGELASEEARTRLPSAISIVRVLRECFAAPDERHFGLYGAFGYDLVFALDAVQARRERDPDQRDLVLYVPDTLLVVDRGRGFATRFDYEFEYAGQSTAGLPRSGETRAFAGAQQPAAARDHAPGEFAGVVRAARERFACGDLFEVTPSQLFRAPCSEPPSQLFSKLCAQDPAPYGFLLNLGQQEYLIGASPEMYVRVEGRRVETCPIAGTIARGADAIGDAVQIRKLLGSDKDESELTMCTDVDRNDKARVCEPGSIRVLGRRQIELYSRLIHTVDHVEGRLREGYDGLDAFMTHLWAVTVTGAPKLAALQFIEDHERSPRRFYGGAVGRIGFDGHINTGLTLRALRVAHGVAEIRSGATLLFESDPFEEEAETELKASALVALLTPAPRAAAKACGAATGAGRGRHVLLVDHEDSFVHTLADYFRQTGASVTTLRHGFGAVRLAELEPHLCVLSPGPGRPAQFGMSALLEQLIARAVPVFGVCLGLQGIVEHFGGRLAQLATPVHGKPSTVRTGGGALFAGLPETLTVGRYHSLYAERATLPEVLRVTASAEPPEPDVIMAIEHRSLPLWAVQFHPESILSVPGACGLRIVENVMTAVADR